MGAAVPLSARSAAPQTPLSPLVSASEGRYGRGESKQTKENKASGKGAGGRFHAEARGGGGEKHGVGVSGPSVPHFRTRDEGATPLFACHFSLVIRLYKCRKQVVNLSRGRISRNNPILIIIIFITIGCIVFCYVYICNALPDIYHVDQLACA